MLKVTKQFLVSLMLIISLSIYSHIVAADAKNGEMEIVQLSDNVYQHVSYNLWKKKFTPSNGIVFIDQQNAYIIDTPWRKQDTRKLVEWIKQKGFQLQASISTHFHDDRSSGIEFLNQVGVKTVASKLTNQLLKKEKKASANIGFEGDHYWLLAGKIQAFYPGAGHSMDNLVVWLADQNILVGGCIIRSAESRGMGYTADGSIADWSGSVSNIQKKFEGVKIVIPGHGKIGDQSLLTHTIKLANQAMLKQ